MGRHLVREEGYAAGALGLGGDSLRAVVASVEEIPTDTLEKGRLLGRRLTEGLTEPPQLVLVHHDSVCGADADAFLQGH